MPPGRRPSSDASDYDLAQLIRRDHDLLIKLETKVDLLISNVSETRNALDARINETRTALSARIDNLAREKADNSSLDTLRRFMEQIQKDNDDRNDKQDKLIAWNTRAVFIAIGAIGALELLLKFIK